MKKRKLLSNILIGIGCVALFISLAAFLLPRIDNEQLRLVLSSFETPSSNPVIQTMNDGMLFAMENCYPLMLISSMVSLLGILLSLGANSTEPQQPAAKRRTSSQRVRNASALPVIPSKKNPFASLPMQTAPRPANATPTENNPFIRYTPVERNKSEATPAGSNLSFKEREDHSFAARHFFAPEEVPKTIQSPEFDNSLSAANIIPDSNAEIPQDDLFIAYRRKPATSAQPEAPAVFEPAEDDLSFSAIPASAASLAHTHAVEQPNAPAPEAAEQPVSSRPVIRSTFRKTYEDQPISDVPDEAAQTPVPVVSEPFSETAFLSVQPAASDTQPVVRIKSTMGRRR